MKVPFHYTILYKTTITTTPGTTITTNTNALTTNATNPFIFIVIPPTNS